MGEDLTQGLDLGSSWLEGQDIVLDLLLCQGVVGQRRC